MQDLSGGELVAVEVVGVTPKNVASAVSESPRLTWYVIGGAAVVVVGATVVEDAVVRFVDRAV